MPFTAIASGNEEVTASVVMPTAPQLTIASGRCL